MLHDAPVAHERGPADDVPHEHTGAQFRVVLEAFRVSFAPKHRLAKDHSREYEQGRSARPIRARVRRTGRDAMPGRGACPSRRRTRCP